METSILPCVRRVNTRGLTTGAFWIAQLPFAFEF